MTILKMGWSCYECGGGYAYFTTDTPLTADMIEHERKAYKRWYDTVYLPGLKDKKSWVKYRSYQDTLMAKFNLVPLKADLEIYDE